MHAYPWTRRAPKTLLPALLLLGVSCGPGGDARDTTAPENVRVTGGVSAGETVSGRRTLQATAADNSGTVTRMEFHVSGALVCSDGAPKSSGATFSCSWDASTAAQGESQLTARAYDAAGNATASEPISFTVAPPNRIPIIGKVSATSSSLDEGASTSLSVTASDPDGDPLTYVWTQSPFSPAGTFDLEAGAARTWTAPFLSRDTAFTLKVTVSDGRGGSAQATVAVSVANVPGLNQAPVVDDTLTVPTTPVLAGDTVSLFIGANDPDGDPLTYSWTTTPAGIFADSPAAVAQWRSSDIGANTTYSFEVTVSDGTASVTRSGLVQVNVPSYSRDIQPIWNTTCTDCHHDAGGTPEGFSLQEGSSHASLVDKMGAGACSPMLRVRPGQPDSSLLVQRLSGEDCGRRMPQFDSDYFDMNPGELTRIRSWILAGALND
ncbi:PKD domain-containing protein [Archangium violaceum]|uniref:Ig-like domain-containing protein n=1 Tax=Archangium violaceum TaxID=83451 RepID=UPI00193B057E|nr:Ig-like domain-containing protein [Archangium violaceum]QRK07399.1 PKD domain-containing protein [Archangium violaceum]